MTRHLTYSKPENNLELLFANDLVLTANGSQVLLKRLEIWRDVMESHGLKCSRKKTEFMSSVENENLQLQGIQLNKVDRFKYLGVTMSVISNTEQDIRAKVQAGWSNWRKVSGVLCDKRVPNKLKGKVHQTVVRPAMLYGAELWAHRKSDMDYLKVSERRMMRWCLCKTRKDRVRNDWSKHQLQVMPIEEQVNTVRLRWFGHVLRRLADHLTRMAWDRSWAKRGRG